MDEVNAESVIQQILQYQRSEAHSETGISFKKIKESSSHSRYWVSGPCCHEGLSNLIVSGDWKGIRQIQEQQVYICTL